MIFVVPHGAPEGYEWFVALVVLVWLYSAVRNFIGRGSAALAASISPAMTASF
jgi:hypothetical protein